VLCCAVPCCAALSMASFEDSVPLEVAAVCGGEGGRGELGSLERKGLGEEDEGTGREVKIHIQRFREYCRSLSPCQS